jgi:hypothetical protein
MPKGGLRITEKRIQALIEEGRGQGELESYLPWLTVRDVPSHALQRRPKGWQTRRTVHLFSQLEYKVWLWLNWLGFVDIREQFPLHPWRETTRIAHQFGFHFPRDWKTKHAIVMTHDFLVTVRTGSGFKHWAIAVKPSEHLKDRRIVEKLWIEREYAKRYDLWSIMTEKELPKLLIKNLHWVAYHYFVETLSIAPATLELVTYELTRRVIGSSDILDNIAKNCDKDLDIQEGTSMSTAQHLIASKFWSVDMMNTPIGPDQPILLLNSSKLY